MKKIKKLKKELRYLSSLEKISTYKVKKCFIAYVRKSSRGDIKQPNSIENQIREIMDYIKYNNISLLELTDELRKEFYDDRNINLDNFEEDIKKFLDTYLVVIDKGSASSQTMEERVQFRKLLNFIEENNNFHTEYGIICTSSDRLSRNNADIHNLFKKIYIKITLPNKIITNICELGMMNELSVNEGYSKGMSDYEIIARENMVRKGNYNSFKKYYGFILNNGELKIDNRTKTEDGIEKVPNYELIRDAFEMRLQKKSKTKIVSELKKNKLNILKYVGDKKEETAFSSMASLNTILKNPVYMGFYISAKLNIVDIFTDIKFPLIIDMKTYYEVNDINIKDILFDDNINKNSKKHYISIYDDKTKKKYTLDFANGKLSKKYNNNIFASNIKIKDLRLKSRKAGIIKGKELLNILYEIKREFSLYIKNNFINNEKGLILNEGLFDYYNKLLYRIRNTIYELTKKLGDENELSNYHKFIYENNLNILEKNKDFIINTIMPELCISLSTLENFIELFNKNRFDDFKLLNIINMIFMYSIDECYYNKEENKIWIKFSNTQNKYIYNII